ncbi:tyrosinase family protein [Bacillus thuringiensis]|nr:tyrosinase family protein [Bacillus thuringiensis]PGL85194.1 hypothetical protein CN944_00455 [Bacillus thuringiensis]PGT89178.1 hypothetical protein COD17_11725 [Bacillus thuringiensis]
MRIRKNQANLTHNERLTFTNALLELKRRPSRLPSSLGSTSRYDDYVYWHLMSMMDQTSTKPGSAHGGPAFLPWHRYFIILAKKTPSSRSVKGHSPVSRWEMNWLRTRDGRKPS